MSTLMIGIAEEKDIETVFIGKLLVAFLGISAYTDDLCTKINEFLQCRIELHSLYRTARGVVSWIKIQNHPFSAECIKTERSSLCIRKTEIRCRFPDKWILVQFRHTHQKHDGYPEY